MHSRDTNSVYSNAPLAVQEAIHTLKCQSIGKEKHFRYFNAINHQMLKGVADEFAVAFISCCSHHLQKQRSGSSLQHYTVGRRCMGTCQKSLVYLLRLLASPSGSAIIIL